jgi:hypothetical protein
MRFPGRPRSSFHHLQPLLQMEHLNLIKKQAQHVKVTQVAAHKIRIIIRIIVITTITLFSILWTCLEHDCTTQVSNVWGAISVHLCTASYTMSKWRFIECWGVGRFWEILKITIMKMWCTLEIYSGERSTGSPEVCSYNSTCQCMNQAGLKYLELECPRLLSC